MDIQTQVLMLAQQPFYQLSHLPAHLFESGDKISLVLLRPASTFLPASVPSSLSSWDHRFMPQVLTHHQSKSAFYSRSHNGAGGKEGQEKLQTSLGISLLVHLFYSFAVFRYAMQLSYHDMASDVISLQRSGCRRQHRKSEETSHQACRTDAPATEKCLPFLSIQLKLQMSVGSKWVRQHIPEGAEGVQTGTHTKVSSLVLCHVGLWRTATLLTALLVIFLPEDSLGPVHLSC